MLNTKQSAVAAADGTFLPGAPGTDEVSALPLIMLVAGAPNTGKSSLINALRRACSDRHGQKLRSRKPARTGALPGVTRGLGGFQVSVRPPVWLLDTPGVLPPRIDSWEAALRLGALDLIKEGKGESEALGSYILHLLSCGCSRNMQRRRGRTTAPAALLVLVGQFRCAARGRFQ